MYFKKIIIVLLICCPVSVMGQRFEGGVMAGMVASQVDGDTYGGYNKFGLTGGAFVNTALSQNLNLHFEIKYISKGAKKKVTEQDRQQYTSNLHYIELPVAIQLKTSKKISWETGLGFAYLFTYSESDENGYLPDIEAAKFSSFDLNIIAGANYAFTNRITGNIRYAYSLIPILNYGKSQALYFQRGAFNNLFTFNVFYTLGKAK